MMSAPEPRPPGMIFWSTTKTPMPTGFGSTSTACTTSLSSARTVPWTMAIRKSRWRPRSGARVRSRHVAMVLVLLFVAACTKSEAGQPSASGGGETSQSTRPPTSGSGAPTVKIPPRPKDLRLNDVDPCALFTKAQLAEIKIDRTRRTTDGTQQYQGMPKCELDQNPAPFDHYYVVAATNEGIG